MPTPAGTLRLFQFRGIVVFLHWTWLVVAAYEISGRPQVPSVASLVLGVSVGIVTLMVLFIVVIALTAAARTPHGEYVVFARHVAVAAFVFASLPAAATMWLFHRYRRSLTAFDLALQRFDAGETAR